MGVFCEPALWVELLTVRPCAEKEGRGTVKSSFFPQGLRPWRAQSSGPAIMPPTPALIAVRAPRTSWPKPSTTSSGDVERSSLDWGRSGTPPLHPRPALLVTKCVQLCADSFQQIPTPMAASASPAGSTVPCLQKVMTFMARNSLDLFELVEVWALDSNGDRSQA